MTSRYDGIQNYIMRAGESCFFLCLLSIAEEERERLLWRPTFIPIDFLDAVRHCMEKGWLRNDFFINDDCAILSYLTGEKCTKEVVQYVGVVKGNQYTIEKWSWNGCTHFKRRAWDVYKDSKTVKNGNKMCTYKYTFKE